MAKFAASFPLSCELCRDSGAEWARQECQRNPAPSLLKKTDQPLLLFLPTPQLSLQVMPEIKLLAGAEGWKTGLFFGGFLPAVLPE